MPDGTKREAPSFHEGARDPKLAKQARGSLGGFALSAISMVGWIAITIAAGLWLRCC